MTLPTLGILGTGHLASYTVAGLRNNNDNRKIILSPRNVTVAQRLSSKFGCRVTQSNQSVLDQADIILLAVRPHQIDELLQELSFNPEHLIISAIAGVDMAQLHAYPNLTGLTLVRTLPIVSAEVNSGPVPLFPDNQTASRLLQNLGTVMVFDDESLFDIASVHSCMHGWVYFWLDEMVQWTIGRGASPEQARQMIIQTVQGALDLSQHTQASLNQTGDSIATPGTYTLSGLEQLQSAEALLSWSRAMQHVLDKLKSLG